MVLVVSRHLFQCIQLTTCMCCINAITINCELQVNSKLALGNPRKVNLFVFTEFGTLYQKLSDAVLKYGYSIRDVPKDGNCGLHAVVDQLRMQGITGWCVANLRQKAVDDINASHGSSLVITQHLINRLANRLKQLSLTFVIHCSVNTNQLN